MGGVGRHHRNVSRRATERGEDSNTGKPVDVWGTKGRVEAILAPSMTIDSYSLDLLVDLEGDGQDEVIWQSSYYEGSYSQVMAWDAAGELLSRTLTGDGA